VLYQIIGALISLFSGLDILFIARWAGIVQLLLGSALFYIICNKIVKNSQISILCTFIASFSFSYIGFLINLSLYWPTALSIILGMQFTIQYLNHLEKYRLKEITLQHNIGYFLEQALLIIIIDLSHITNGALVVLPFLFATFFMLFQDRKLILDFAIYAVLFAVNFILNNLRIDTLIPITLSSKELLILIVIGIPILIILVLFIKKWLDKHTYRLNTPEIEETPDENNNNSLKIEKRILRKYLIPFAIIGMPIILGEYFISQHTEITLNFIFWMIDLGMTLVFFMFAVVGFLIYRKSNLMGKSNFLLAIFMVILFLALSIIGTNSIYIYRIILLYFPLIITYIGLYFLYSLHNWLQIQKNQKFLMLFCCISLSISMVFQSTIPGFISDSQYNLVQFSVNHTPNAQNNYANVMYLGNLNYNYLFIYDNNSIWFDRYFGSYFFPNIQIQNISGIETNQLQDLMKYYSLANLYLIIDNTYFINGIVGIDNKNYGIMNNAEYLQYYNASYLDCVCVSINMNTIFWVVPA
jgi:MFS family permease